jgi:hypothetical protein
MQNDWDMNYFRYQETNKYMNWIGIKLKIKIKDIINIIWSISLELEFCAYLEYIFISLIIVNIWYFDVVII